MEKHHVVITGGIASGKSVAAKVFEILGASVYNADANAKRLMQSDPDIRQMLTDRFGQQVYAGDELNTDFVSSIIFESTENRRFVETIVHPAVLNDYLSWRETITCRVSVLELALIHSLPLREISDTIIVIDSSDELRIDRLMQRNGYTRKEALQRIASQPLRAEYVKIADIVIDNNGVDFFITKLIDSYHQLPLQ
ncbi:MAG: dephospho-CoA kinase [Bacteroidales bacterium]|nr:dephospho-CoA kinase [Bacteroidales bacterium]HOY38921.1 dephospho-CoA kinase [Bacteroidales bacterium]HQN92575.1 dephospho-CoA kinase [Prolixibacteraceae bacterium]